MLENCCLRGFSVYNRELWQPGLRLMQEENAANGIVSDESETGSLHIFIVVCLNLCIFKLFPNVSYFRSDMLQTKLFNKNILKRFLSHNPRNRPVQCLERR